MKYIRPYIFTLCLLFSLLLGSITGYVLGPSSVMFKPLGDVFLNLLFTAVVPLIFFSVSAAIAHLGGTKKLLKLVIVMFATFLFTGTIAGLLMTCVVTIFPPAQGLNLQLGLANKIDAINITNQIVSIFTVSDFSQLFSHKNILPLIIFSILVGLATASLNEKGKSFATFLQSGADIFMKVISLILYFAPIGFFAYFAVLVGELGTQLITTYLRALIIYYSAGVLYFIVGFTFYAYLAGGITKIKLFWKNILIPVLTAFATCSSAASIPVNLQASKQMKISADVYETVIPIGAIIHKDGSVIGAIVKIAFLFGIFGMSFSGPSVILTALMVALLVGTVMGAIPSGGMLGEMLIISLYGFPPQALVVIAAIGMMIDPLATMLNTTGDDVAAMLVDRWLSR